MNAAQRITVALLGMVVGAVMVLVAGVVGATNADADTGIGTAVAIAAKCSTDEGGIKHHPCFQGNGIGKSFKRRANGDVVYVSHRRAHCMTRTHVVGSCPKR